MDPRTTKVRFQEPTGEAEIPNNIKENKSDKEPSNEVS